MKIAEILEMRRFVADGLELDKDEIDHIDQDEEIKRRPKARNMLFTVMPGNDSTYPAL